jgi:hypothetical protein
MMKAWRLNSLSSFESVDRLRVEGNILRGALWGVEDEEHMRQEYQPIGTMCKIRKELIKYYESLKDHSERKAFHPVFVSRFSELSNSICKTLYSYEKRIEDFWHDRRSGTTWKDGKKFEPHVTIIEHNRTLNDGVDRYSLLISGETIKVFRFIAGGTSNIKPNPGQWGLGNEAFRNIADFLSGQGNVVKMGLSIPKGQPTTSFKEFGGCDEPVDPSTFDWRVRIKNAPFLDHVQGVTSPQVNHTTLLVVEKTV